MTSVKVHMPLPAAVSKSDLDALLVAAGLSASSADDWIAHCPGGDNVPVLLVIAANDVAAAKAMENAVNEAVARGERVIIMWPLGAESSALPSVLEDYGTSLVNWDNKTLHAAICGQTPEWQDPEGGARAKRTLERNSNC